MSATNQDERIILGHLLRFPEYAAEILDGLDADDFSSPKCKAIFEAIRDNVEDAGDLRILSNVLKSRAWEIYPSDLIALQDEAIAGVDLSRCKRDIRVASQKRNFADFLTAAVKDLRTLDSDLQAIREGLLQKISGISTELSGGKFLKRPAEFSAEIQNQGENGTPAILTGLKGLDELLAGLRPNELTLVTGETASGKTTFAAAHLPYSLSHEGHPILIASFEMKPLAILKKMVQMTTGRPFNELTRAEIKGAMDLISGLPLSFVDVYGELGLRELKSCLYHARKEYGIEVAVLDHLHYFLKCNADQERQAIDLALRNIKSWAMDLGIHIFLVVHPTKIETENRPIRLNDLKGSSGLKQIPDNVLSIWRPRNPDDFKHPKSEVLLFVLKVRDDAGDEGKVILTFDKRSQSYSDSGHGGASPSQGKGSSRPSPSVRPGRDWANGTD